MTFKLLEIRDSATFIPAAAFSCNGYEADSEAGAWLLRRAGFGISSDCIFLVKLRGGGAEYDVYAWRNARTMQVAHKYIEEHWKELRDGDVIDVEFILGETKEIKTSERLDPLFQ